ncbi:MAG: Alanine--tRNA ligase [Chlamydiae bacterium]|nr:Alanine--tRNA ligase [Chlamydiota bacterium]
MKKPTSQEVRRAFLSYFEKNGHTKVPSSPVVPHDDPTLLFTNAGMNQFKDVFLGQNKRSYTRATTSQKCVRVGGKHNDLENVGHTTRHLTFFEMLGNFSFGDYFKKQAIDFAWEVTLEIFQLDPKYLYATVFHEDEESFALWKAYLPEERIVRMGEKDNFWAMGDTGPCGPCSELYFDRGEGFGSARSPAEDIEGERFLEFWNLVFIESNREPSGILRPLPNKCVDTGAGLERILSILLGVDSLFETDVIRTLIGEVESLSSIQYDPHGKNAPPFRVIADHLRTLAFAIADGVQPSNIERGYVLRKVVRRAVRYGKQLGIEKPFLADLLPRLSELMGEDFPELLASQERTAEILTLEEEGFLRTLKRGGALLGQVIEKSTKVGEISGEDSFKLKDTYGLPLEEILLLAKDAHLAVDISRFEELEHEAKLRSRGARKETVQLGEESAFASYLETHGPAQFLGYRQLSAEAVVLGIFRDGEELPVLHEGEEGTILLDQTPFYAEKGGQVGDQGEISSESALFTVIDCQSPYSDVITHKGVLKSGEIRVGERVSAHVNQKRRQKIANHHTATHLLHWALRHVLGPHIKQAGSVVEATRLRFDFSHHKPLSSEEITQIETLVNEKIRENRPVHSYELAHSEAQTRDDIIQFFGEKYGEYVRVIDLDYSKELCGGTHTTATGTLGYFRITKESSIAAGIRRIEAVAGEEANKFVHESEDLLLSLAKLFKAQPAQLPEKGEKLLEEKENLAKELTRLKRELLSVEVENLLAHIEETNGVSYLLHSLSLAPKELKECADLVVEKCSPLILLLIGIEENKCTFLTRISPEYAQKGFHAGKLIQKIAPIVGGKGGGKPEAAQGGGTNPENSEKALHEARQWISSLT